MILTKDIKNLRALFAVLSLAVFAGFGASIANAQTPTPTPKVLFDFQGTGRTSFTTLDLPTGGPITWKVTGNPAAAGANQAFKRSFTYGLFDSDSIVPGDYSGDRKSEVAVWRDTNATYYISQFPTGTGGVTLERAVAFGSGATDSPVTGDYDGDGKTDFAVVRVVNNNLVWYIMSSSTSTMRTITFGTLTGVPVSNGNYVLSLFPGADFNGDGRDELVYVTTNSSLNNVMYYVGDAVTGAGVITRNFGNYSIDATLAPSDYTGDGRADFVTVRQTQGAQEVFYIQNSATNAVTATSFGLADPTFEAYDFPVRGDYDGDGRSDIAVWRASNQTFYYISSANGSIQGQKSGDATDFPLAGLAGF